MLAALTDLLTHHLALVVAVAVLLVTLVLGAKDLSRLSFTRILAISSVAWRQAVRRRVLWITPLVIVGILIFSQLQKAVDAQDAVRQTIKLCLFATGLLVTLLMLLLVSTNLPKEIDSRVIYTIATKPATRLEIVLGKVLGFARISAAILLIMGAFTWGYLEYRQWRLLRDVQTRLSAGAVDEISRSTLENYVNMGLLHARRFQPPQSLQVFADLPRAGQTPWAAGASQQTVLIPFDLPPGAVPPPPPLEQTGELGPALPAQDSASPFIELRVQHRLVDAAIQPADAESVTPALALDLLSADLFSLSSAAQERAPDPLPLPSGPEQPLRFSLSGKVQETLSKTEGRVYVAVVSTGRGVQITVPPDAARLVIPLPPELRRDGAEAAVLPAQPPVFIGRRGPGGQQIAGDSTANGPAAVFRFRDGSSSSGRFQLQVGVERDSDLDANQDRPTILAVYWRSEQGSWNQSPQQILPDPNRPLLFDLPVQIAADEPFDIAFRCLTDGQWVSFRLEQAAAPAAAGLSASASLRAIAGQQPFVLNLFKSLAILWLMSLLVIITALFCSTFLSWPIAVVLTVMILTGHWGARQISDLTQPGFGRQIVTDLFKSASPAESKVVAESVERLTSLLQTVARFLPDLSQFSAIDAIEGGIAIPARNLVSCLLVVLGFGLPLMALSYIFLKYKEVAP